jgi:predicted  nucleic acid-binding Zn-ribbon protein
VAGSDSYDRNYEMLDQRLKSVEERNRQHSDKIAQHGEQLAELRVTQTTTQAILAEIRASLAAESRELREHVIAEAKDRGRMFVGIVTAALGTLGTLALLLWGIWTSTSYKIP